MSSWKRGSPSSSAHAVHWENWVHFVYVADCVHTTPTVAYDCRRGHNKPQGPMLLEMLTVTRFNTEFPYYEKWYISTVNVANYRRINLIWVMNRFPRAPAQWPPPVYHPILWVWGVSITFNMLQLFLIVVYIRLFFIVIQIDGDRQKLS